MIDWDDIRYFLAAARGGSVRTAAKNLGVKARKTKRVRFFTGFLSGRLTGYASLLAGRVG